jgi:outer membrane protein assembly factor BamB
MVCSTAITQEDLELPPVFFENFNNHPLLSLCSEDIIVDDFEYQGNPYGPFSHGWIELLPPCPITFCPPSPMSVNTILDHQKDSLVLEMYYPEEFDPFYSYDKKYFIARMVNINLDPGAGYFHPCLCFEVYMPSDTNRSKDIFEFRVFGITEKGSFAVLIKPSLSINERFLNDSYQATMVDNGTNTDMMIIRVDLNHNLLNDYWHLIQLDLNEINEKVHNGSVPAGWKLSKVYQIHIGGHFRLDNIMFKAGDSKILPVGLADSPWPCLGHDARHTGQSQYIGSQTNTLKWSYKTGDTVFSSPVIGPDGTIYIGNLDKKVYALNPDGTLKWSYQTEGVLESSPAIGFDGTIYTGSQDGKVYALNPDGTLKWSYQTDSSVASSPVIGDDGTVYIGSHDNRLYALNPDGSLKWDYDTRGEIASSPAIGAENTVYVGSNQSESKVFAIDPNGVVKWSCQIGFLETSSPAIGDDGTIYIGNHDRKVYAINPKDGSIKWSFQTGCYIIPSPAISADGTIYVGNAYIFAINSDGSLKWIYDPPYPIPQGGGIDIISSPAIGADGTIYTGSFMGYVYGLNPKDGSLKWSYWTEDYIHQSSPAIDANGTIYVGCCDGKVYPFRGDIFCYFDADEDGYGDPNHSIQATFCPEGYVKNDFDCNDMDHIVYPGASGTYEGKDNNCNGTIDKDEEKRSSSRPSYLTYTPILLSLYLQYPQLRGTYYQESVIPLWSSLMPAMFQQLPWKTSWQPAFYIQPFIQAIFPGSQFWTSLTQPYLYQPYFQYWNFFNYQQPQM